MRRLIVKILVLWAAGTTAWSQTPFESQGAVDPLAFDHSELEGIRLYSVYAFLGYSDYQLPQTNTSNALTNTHTKYGISGSAGWQRFHGNTNFSIRYTGSYNGDAQQSSLNSLNHAVALTFSRRLWNRWVVDLSGTGQYVSIEQFVFQPSTLGSVSQTPATFDDLAAAMSVGQFTTPQGGLLLTNYTATTTPSTAVLLGSNILIYALHTGLTYEHSSRLSFRLGGFALGGERRAGGDTIPGVQLNYVMPRTIGGDLTASLSYLLSPRTEVELSVAENYMTTVFQRSFGTNATVGLGRKMGRHWFLRGYGGGYFVENLQQATGTPMTRQIIGGGAVGFQTHSNTLLGSYNRSGYDLNAAAVGSNTIISGAWNWHQPRRSWGLHATYSRTETSNTGFANVSGWQAMVGFSQRILDNILMQATYSHLRSRGVYATLANNVTVDALRLTIGWSPRPKYTSSGIHEEEPEHIQ